MTLGVGFKDFLDPENQDKYKKIVSFGLSANDAKKAIDWATRVSLSQGLLTSVLSGMIQITSFKNNEPQFRVTEIGVRRAEKMIKDFERTP